MPTVTPRASPSCEPLCVEDSDVPRVWAHQAALERLYGIPTSHELVHPLSASVLAAVRFHQRSKLTADIRCQPDLMQWNTYCKSVYDDWHRHERFPTLAVFGCFEMLQVQC